MKTFPAIWVLGLIFSAAIAAFGQQPGLELSRSDLDKHTYYFDVEGNALTGEGAKFLVSEFAKSQFVIIGEYHGSLRISEFTEAAIPRLHESGFRTLALEVGPISVQLLRELSTPHDATAKKLHDFNTKYLARGERNTFTPIPFFGNVEDADFLAAASLRKWKLIGLDQEFAFGYLPLIDRMFSNLDRRGQRDLAELQRIVTDQIKEFYAGDLAKDRDRSNGNDMYSRIQKSAEVSRFLDEAAKRSSNNVPIAEAIRRTTELYRLNVVRQYYDTNRGRVGYMKENLGRGFDENGFDAKKDKMLLKMGSVHTGRGFSPLSLFEIGNTLSELADLNGSSSLHISFGTRFYTDGGKEVDALGDKAGFLYRFGSLTQMAERDRWTVIDLRPLREAVFYHRKFKLDDVVNELFKNHDLLIIPKLETDPTANYDMK